MTKKKKNQMKPGTFSLFLSVLICFSFHFYPDNIHSPKKKKVAITDKKMMMKIEY